MLGAHWVRREASASVQPSRRAHGRLRTKIDAQRFLTGGPMGVNSVSPLTARCR